MNHQTHWSTMNSLINLSIAEALRLLKNKKLSVTDLLKAHTDRAEETKNLNAYVLMTEKQALDQAKKSEIKYKNGEAGLIEVIPIAVKDLFCTKGIRTTSCSKMLYNFIPENKHKLNGNISYRQSFIVKRWKNDCLTNWGIKLNIKNRWTFITILESIS